MSKMNRGVIITQPELAVLAFDMKRAVIAINAMPDDNEFSVGYLETMEDAAHSAKNLARTIDALLETINGKGESK